MRLGSRIQLSGLIVLSVLAGLAINSRGPLAWFQSPVSPVSAPGLPDSGTAISPLPATGGLAAVKVFGASVQTFWVSVLNSLWLWFVLGVILFGGLAWVLVRIVRRLDMRRLDMRQ